MGRLERGSGFVGEERSPDMSRPSVSRSVLATRDRVRSCRVSELLGGGKHLGSRLVGDSVFGLLWVC